MDRRSRMKEAMAEGLKEARAWVQNRPEVIKAGCLALALSLLFIIYAPAFFFGLLVGASSVIGGEVLLLKHLWRKIRPPKKEGSEAGNAPAPDPSVAWVSLRPCEADEGKTGSGKLRKNVKLFAPLLRLASLEVEERVLALAGSSQGESETILLDGCDVKSFSETSGPEKRWARKFPIRISHPSRVLFQNAREFFIYFPNGRVKQAWCRALRAAAFPESEDTLWQVQVSQAYAVYLGKIRASRPDLWLNVEATELEGGGEDARGEGEGGGKTGRWGEGRMGQRKWLRKIRTKQGGGIGARSGSGGVGAWGGGGGGAGAGAGGGGGAGTSLSTESDAATPAGGGFGGASSIGGSNSIGSSGGGVAAAAAAAAAATASTAASGAGGGWEDGPGGEESSLWAFKRSHTDTSVRHRPRILNSEGNTTDTTLTSASSEINSCGIIHSVAGSSGVNQTGTNLSGFNLPGFNLSGVNLTGVNLSGVNLTAVNSSGVRKRGHGERSQLEGVAEGAAEAAAAVAAIEMAHRATMHHGAYRQVDGQVGEFSGIGIASGPNGRPYPSDLSVILSGEPTCPPAAPLGSAAASDDAVATDATSAAAAAAAGAAAGAGATGGASGPGNPGESGGGGGGGGGGVGGSGSGEPEGAVQWANALLCRLYFDLSQEDALSKKLQAKFSEKLSLVITPSIMGPISCTKLSVLHLRASYSPCPPPPCLQEKLSLVITPSIMGPISCTKLSLGPIPPLIRSMRTVNLAMPGGDLALDVDLEFKGAAAMNPSFMCLMPFSLVPLFPTLASLVPSLPGGDLALDVDLEFKGAATMTIETSIDMRETQFLKMWEERDLSRAEKESERRAEYSGQVENTPLTAGSEPALSDGSAAAGGGSDGVSSAGPGAGPERLVRRGSGMGEALMSEETAAALVGDMEVAEDVTVEGAATAPATTLAKSTPTKGGRKRNIIRGVRGMVSNMANSLSQVPLTLSFNITSVKGTLRIRVPAPPSDRLWMSFVEMPEIEMQSMPSIGDLKLKRYPMATLLIEKLKALIKRSLVQRSCVDAKLPFMLSHPHDCCVDAKLPFMLSHPHD
ncbi:unnamed protein product, partial [Closterium sp. NIES-65]